MPKDKLGRNAERHPTALESLQRLRQDFQELDTLVRGYIQNQRTVTEVIVGKITRLEGLSTAQSAKVPASRLRPRLQAVFVAAKAAARLCGVVIQEVTYVAEGDTSPLRITVRL
jgi:hypothetical protein